MKQKYYWTIGIIVLVAIGIIFISIPSQKDGKPEPEIVLTPYIDVEATVTSLFLDDLHSDCEAPEICPRDRVTLRIDKIVDRRGYDFPPSFSVLLASEKICHEAREFVGEKLYVEEVGQCEESKIWEGKESLANQKSHETKVNNSSGSKTAPGYRGINYSKGEEPRISATEGYLFSGKFTVGFTREDEQDLREALQERFGAKVSISPYIIEGDEIEFNLKYSARPAKLRQDLPPNCPAGLVFENGSCVQQGCEGSKCAVSSPQYNEKPAEMEGNYIIYHLPQRTDEITEKILPGLKENSKIKIRIWQPNLISKEIGEYELR